jgi:predicted amidohydrolase YtcJ
LTRQQALVAYTNGSAYAEFTDQERGTLARGKQADLAVLSQNIFDVPAEALPATEAVMTMVGGNIIRVTMTVPVSPRHENGRMLALRCG